MIRMMVFIALFFVCLGCSGEEDPPERVVVVETVYAAPAMTKWSYKCIPWEPQQGHSRHSEELVLQFNRLGEEGFEMVGYTITNGACFKRPKPQ